MTRDTLRRAYDHYRLLERRARGLEPGDDLVSRLPLDDLAAAPLRWLKTTAGKLAVVLALAVLAAGVFEGGLALMRVVGIGP